MGAKEDYAAYLKEQEGADSPQSRYQDYLREETETQVLQMRQDQRKGKKPPVLTGKVPNPRNEELVGTKQPRIVGLPPGTIESGLEGIGGAGGATAGALRGAQLGAAFGPQGLAVGGFLGGVVGAGLGLAGTRAAVEGGKALVGARPPISADEAIESGKRAMMEGMAGEGLFRTAAGIPQGYRALKSGLLAGGIKPEQRALYEQAQALGIHLTPDKLTDKKAPKMVANTLRRTLAGGGKFEARDIENELNLRKAVDSWADDALGQYTDQVTQGDLLQKAIKDEVIPAHREMVKALYKDLDEKTGEAKIVDTTDLYGSLQQVRNALAKRGDVHKGAVTTLDDVLERMSDKGPVTGLTVKRETEPVISTFPQKPSVTMKKEVVLPSLESVERGKKPSDKGFVTPEESYLTQFKAKTNKQEVQTGERLTGLRVTEKSDAPRTPRALTFSEAQEIRSIIGHEVGQGGPPLPGSEMQNLKKAYAQMTEEMGKAASGYSLTTGKDVNLSWALADTMNKRGKELFNESVIAKMVERDPEQVVRTVFKKDAITPTRDLVRALETKPEVLNQYRRNVVESLIQEAVDKKTERVVGEDFAKAARKRGERVLSETFGENYPAFKKILEIAERLPKQKENQGLLWFEQGMFIRMAPAAGAGLGFAMDSPGLIGASLAAPAGWYIGTKRLAEIMTNKELANKLLQTQKMDPRSSALMRTMSQLGAIEVGETGRPVEGTPEPRRGLVTGLTQKMYE